MKYLYSTWDEIANELEEHSLTLKSMNAIATSGYDYKEALSKGQLISKLWLLDVAEKFDLFDNKRICICGGWVGILSLLICEKFKPKHITSLDLNPKVTEMANKILYETKANAVTQNMLRYDYSHYDVIINTSFEHIRENDEWAERVQITSQNPTIIIQSNDLEDPEHVNCAYSEKQLEEQMELEHRMYIGKLELPTYTRYMGIGKWK